jgi:hypothetical protein
MILPLFGELLEIFERVQSGRRLDYMFVFHDQVQPRRFPEILEVSRTAVRNMTRPATPDGGDETQRQ